MRILIPGDFKTNGKDNIFAYELLKSLKYHPQTEIVEHGSGWLFENNKDHYDIILFQWPEMIFDWDEPTQQELERLQIHLNYWSERGKIAVTVHNKYPHYGDTKNYRRLYEIIFAHADGVIHLGEVSKKLMRRRYAHQLDKAAETVIPHGNYASIPNTISRGEARKELGYTASDNVLFMMGSIRSMHELRLLLESFRKARRKDGTIKLLISSKLPGGTNRIGYYMRRLPIWLDGHIRLEEKFIRHEEVQLYANTADVFMIPRHKVLNSGNVALGFTFGKVVVGPDVGVVGEQLKETGNPVFDPQHTDDAARAIAEGFKLAKNHAGDKNREYAQAKLNWTSISNQYICFFNELMQPESQMMLAN